MALLPHEPYGVRYEAPSSTNARVSTAWIEGVVLAVSAAVGLPGAELWEVTPSNREALVERVLTWLTQGS
jgi:hypothetical protein